MGWSYKILMITYLYISSSHMILGEGDSCQYQELWLAQTNKSDDEFEFAKLLSLLHLQIPIKSCTLGRPSGCVLTTYITIEEAYHSRDGNTNSKIKETIQVGTGQLIKQCKTRLYISTLPTPPLVGRQCELTELFTLFLGWQRQENTDWTCVSKHHLQQFSPR